MIRTLVKIYATIRGWLNPVRFPEEENPVWKKVRELSMSDFSKWVNSFEYKSDPLMGLLDHTQTFEHFADPDSKDSRDCDDFARMWFLWGVYNGYYATEYIVGDDSIPPKFHVVTVLQQYSGLYTLCDYQYYGPFQTLDECKECLCRNWSHYKMDSLIFQEYISG